MADDQRRAIRGDEPRGRHATQPRHNRPAVARDRCAVKLADNQRSPDRRPGAAPLAAGFGARGVKAPQREWILLVRPPTSCKVPTVTRAACRRIDSRRSGPADVGATPRSSATGYKLGMRPQKSTCGKTPAALEGWSLPRVTQSKSVHSG